MDIGFPLNADVWSSFSDVQMARNKRTRLRLAYFVLPQKRKGSAQNSESRVKVLPSTVDMRHCTYQCVLVFLIELRASPRREDTCQRGGPGFGGLTLGYVCFEEVPIRFPCE